MKELISGLPDNYEELKKQANNQNNWRLRKQAVEELSKYADKRIEDILWRRMISDKVYAVVHAAFLQLQARGAKNKNGQPVRLPRKPKGNLIKGFQNELTKVKNALPENHGYEEFKIALREKKPVIYDTYEGDKQERFDNWLENVWKTLPKKK